MSHELLVVVGGDEDTVMDLLLEDDDPPFDGYVLGGRWSGWLRLRPGASGRLGERGVGDDRPDDDPSLAGRADCAVLGDVDVEGMRAEAERAAGEHGDRWRRAVDGLPPDRSFPEVAAQVEAEAEAEARRQRRGLLRRPAPPPTGEELRRRTLAAHAAQPRQAALRAVLDLERVVLPDQASPDDLRSPGCPR